MASDVVAAVEAAGLSGIWERWQAHVGGSASQQLTHAEQWAEWVSAGLADALRLQVPETIGDTEVRSPARHLAGAMSNRAEEARRIDRLFGPVAAKYQGGRRALAQTLEQVQVCAAWRSREATRQAARSEAAQPLN